MTCRICENKVGHSFKEEPFFPPGGYKFKQNNTYECHQCGQKWYCYNDHFCLWGKVEDDLTWKFLINNIDVLMAIGDICAVVPGYEEHAIDPVHEVCSRKVSHPEISLGDEKTAFLQWTGEYGRGRMNIFCHQFKFPIMSLEERFMEKIDTFRVPFVGQIRDWPDEGQRQGMIETFGDEEKSVVYLMSAEFTHDYGDDVGPVSFISEVVLLGDPNVGLIRPGYFFDSFVVEMVNGEFKGRK
jgi:hypothetical protein